MSETIWVMDSDLCEMCDGLLDYFGECPHCGYDSIYGYSWDDTSEEEDEDGWEDLWLGYRWREG